MTPSTIDSYIPHIQNREEFYVLNKEGGYTVIGYRVNTGTTFEWNEEDQLGSIARLECRGLIFDTASGKLISRPYHKFFNVNETEQTRIENLDLSNPHVILEKLDGSMIRPIFVEGEYRLATKAGITDVSNHAEDWMKNHPNYLTFIQGQILNGNTPIFEWCSRKDRIVVDYPVDRLVLTAIRNTNDGWYYTYSEMKGVADAYGIDLVKVISPNSSTLDEIVKEINAWDDSNEGVVIRFEETGMMVKVKAEHYVLLHKTKELFTQEKNIITLILEDKLDDVLPLLQPNERERIKSYQRAFWMSIDEVGNNLVDLYLKEGLDYPEQKDFALGFVSKLPKHQQPFMFGLRRGLSVNKMLMDGIKKSLKSNKAIDNARWMWGSLEWKGDSF